MILKILYEQKHIQLAFDTKCPLYLSYEHLLGLSRSFLLSNVLNTISELFKITGEKKDLGRWSMSLIAHRFEVIYQEFSLVLGSVYK